MTCHFFSASVFEFAGGQIFRYQFFREIPHRYADFVFCQLSVNEVGGEHSPWFEAIYQLQGQTHISVEAGVQ
ncbi:hypothetical protein GHO41_11765 [Pseudomonas sp. FSL R10-0399]|uniref:hypothetical protein n=1 Tax=Pseudomonas sp. FSL R10-0399 TaxID=2662194 RepID=UPI001297312B|nr:hypothetical protein [Pseudomonas sp. FSL R10-0399]MQT58019.1 hypothetical protein [Pseudomonas sp. FSL R10-0399]